MGVGPSLTLGAFVGGYVAGMKMGDRPIEAARNSMDQARAKATEAGNAASRSGDAGRASADISAAPANN